MEETKQIKLEAFKLHANVYFIGSEAVSVHLIDTERGLVLIDTGYPNMGELILSNIKKLGFDPKNITAIFHSHGHIDHFGNTEMIAEVSGAKTYISRIDNDIVNGTYDLSWAKELGLARLPFFSCDVLVEDGDSFDFGNSTVRCVHTPGHTDGVMSFIITLADGKIAAMHGGIGTNSMASAFLLEYDLPFDCRRKFKEGLKRLAEEHVDLVLGNHAEQTNTLGKMLKVKAGHEVLDTEEWACFLAKCDKMIDSLAEDDPEPQK